MGLVPIPKSSDLSNFFLSIIEKPPADTTSVLSSVYHKTAKCWLPCSLLSKGIQESVRMKQFRKIECLLKKSSLLRLLKPGLCGSCPVDQSSKVTHWIFRSITFLQPAHWCLQQPRNHITALTLSDIAGKSNLASKLICSNYQRHYRQSFCYNTTIDEVLCYSKKNVNAIKFIHNPSTIWQNHEKSDNLWKITQKLYNFGNNVY